MAPAGSSALIARATHSTATAPAAISSAGRPSNAIAAMITT